MARADARILVLGSLPSRRSIQAGQYYAHPQNAFWKIMRDLFGARGDYAERCRTLIDSRIALWDVLRCAVRAGSMDADIRSDTSEVNDFKSFFEKHDALELICFNGRKAAQLFRSIAAKDGIGESLCQEVLPSTSPAYASMSYADKLEIWRGTMIIE